MLGKVAFIPLVSKIHDENKVKEALRKIEPYVEKYADIKFPKISSISEIEEAPSENIAAYLIYILTGGVEHLALKLSRRRIPVAIIAHEEQNSLAASLELKARLNYEKIPSEIFMLGSYEFESDLKSFIKASKALFRLRRNPILLIGDPSPWLIYSNMQLDSLAKDFDLKYDKVSVEYLVNRFKKISQNEIEELLEKYGIIERKEPSMDNLVSSLKLYVAIRDILRKRKTNIFTIRCFDLLDYGLTACLPLSILNSEGFIGGCEGDILATLSMAILSSISEKPSFIGNIVWIERDYVLFAHCMVPLKLTKYFRFRSHFESNKGLSVEGHFTPGETVTFMRIDGVRRILRAGKGVLANEEPIMVNACRTQMLVKVFGDSEKLVKDTIGNHYVLTFGNYIDELKHFAKIINYSFDEV